MQTSSRNVADLLRLAGAASDTPDAQCAPIDREDGWIMCSKIFVGMVTVGASLVAWGQNAAGANSVSLAPVAQPRVPVADDAGHWTAARVTWPASPRVAALPAPAPSLVGPPVVDRCGPGPMAAVPAPQQVVRYVPVGQSQAAPPPVTVVPGTAPWWVYRPLVPVAAPPPVYYLGRGIIGQPKVYIPGQPVRNALRFLTP